MPVPARSTSFPDILDPRFAKVFNNRYKELDDEIRSFYTVVDGASAPTKDTYRTSQLGTFGDMSEFTGSLPADGFDNLTTAALSAVSVSAARIQMVNFRGDRAERIGVMPSMLLYPPDLYQTAWEIV